MTLQELMRDLRARGIQITTDGEALRLRGSRHVITPTLRQRIMERKREIIVALSRMPSRGELERICHGAVSAYPNVDATRLRSFLEVAEDPAWCTERVARHLARRMAEGMLEVGR